MQQEEYKFNKVIVYGDIKQVIWDFQKKLDEVALTKIELTKQSCTKNVA